MIELYGKDILQINATIIAGALIFLTLLGNSPNLKNVTNLPFVLVLALAVLIIFSLSSVMTIWKGSSAGIEGMKVGFILILIFSFILLSISLIREAKDQAIHFFGITNSTNHTDINEPNVNLTKL